MCVGSRPDSVSSMMTDAGRSKHRPRLARKCEQTIVYNRNVFKGALQS